MNHSAARLLRELRDLTGESEDDALAAALRERLDRMNFQVARRHGADALRRYLVGVAERANPAPRLAQR